MLNILEAEKPRASKRTRPARRPDLAQTNKTPEWKLWSPVFRFHSSYTREDGPIAGSPCWVWDGVLDNEGHGRFAHNNTRNVAAHRYAVEVIDAFGPLGRRRVTHACRNKACVRPDHLRFNRGPESWPESAIEPRLDGYSLSPGDVDRFWKQVDKETGASCWIWAGTVNNGTGYGVMTLGCGSERRRTVGVHRMAYAIAHGCVPDGMLVCHGPECEGREDGRRCVNPEHLIADTPAANMLDQKGGHHRRPLCKIPVSAGTRALMRAFLPYTIEVGKEQGDLDAGASLEEMLAMDSASLNSGTASTPPA